jgi:hypothetical protein
VFDGNAEKGCKWRDNNAGMAKTDIGVSDLIAMIERGELRLPEMQRRYVWRATRVRDLLDSLYRGYPSGGILVWETDEHQPSRDLSVAQHSSPFSGHKLLLDGQQRLTSLSAVLRGEMVEVRGRKRFIDILFNLDHPDGLAETTEVEGDEESVLADEDDAADDESEEESTLTLQERLKTATFVVSSKAMAAQPNWVSVSTIFKSAGDGEILKNAGVTDFADPRYEKYVARLRRLREVRNYQYVMHVLERNLSYEEVAEIFVRVNSLGMKLRGSDLALAQITARWPDSLRLFEEFQAECEEGWFTFDLGLLVRAAVMFASDQCRFRSVARIPVERLQAGWVQAKRGIQYAMNFLRTNAGIEDESLLSSPLYVLTIAYFAEKCGGQPSAAESRLLLYWLLVSNAKGRYSRGSSETLLDEDLVTIRRTGSVQGLVDRLRQQFGRLDFDVNDIAGKNARSPVFSLVFLALRAAGATDWLSGLEVSLTHQGRLHYIQYHHIFPKARLRGRYEQREINEIANLAFIGGGTNRSISAKLPKDYLPVIVQRQGDAALTSQCVPNDPSLHELDRYRDFLAIRREALTQAINAFVSSVT